MFWAFAALILALLGVGAWSRRNDLRRMRVAVERRDDVLEAGDRDARLQEPVIDLAACLGCGTCVRACPEEQVLDLVHGQAAVVHGSRCVGHAVCEQSCPVGAITVSVAQSETRRDIPVLDDELEAVGVKGLFLAGEITARSLIRTAVDHGVAIARRAAARRNPSGSDAFDLIVVGAGPAGLACALEAQRLGLRFRLLEQEAWLGGAVARYPRNKLVLTRPLELPGLGRIKKTEFQKEELIALWERAAADAELPVSLGVRFEGLERTAAGGFVVQSSEGPDTATTVCLAVGRRGSPRALGVPGEDQAKVAYGMLDAASYQGADVLVVGGGDSAVETALALAEQGTNTVTLSYRRGAFFRLHARNQERLDEAVASGGVDVVLHSEVAGIGTGDVRLNVHDPEFGPKTRTIPNQQVFVMAGGDPPFPLLERAGVSFDPEDRAALEGPAKPERPDNTLRNAVAVALLCVAATIGWVLWHADYYVLDRAGRAAHQHHGWLRSGYGLGLWAGVVGLVAILVNLAYLLRRGGIVRWFSLKAWMGSHVVTGVLAVLCALVHAAMNPGADSAGGHGFWALVVLTVTGAMGRYFYAWIPRATNGSELAFDEVRTQLDDATRAWRERGLATDALNDVRTAAEGGRWSASLWGRAIAVLRTHRLLRRAAASFRADARRLDTDEHEQKELLGLLRRYSRAAFAVAHLEDLRGLLSTWRYLHRWAAALMVILVVIHVVQALAHGAFGFDGGLS